MNRRGFLQMLAAATAVSVGGIALIETPRTFFLPPIGGWHQALKIRRIEQYLINCDEMRYRYDTTWDMPNGEARQFHVDAKDPCDEQAIMLLKDRLIHDGGIPNSNHFKLELPRYVKSEYIYA
jgi:hypothetical protein